MSRKMALLITGGLVISLLVNIFVVSNIIRFRNDALSVIVTTRDGLSRLTSEPFIAEVAVDQVIPLELEIEIDETINVPIDTTYYLDTTVQTTVVLPLVGPQRITIPIRENIPLQLELALPVQLNFPISTEYHLDAVLPVLVSLPPETVEIIDQTLQEIEDDLR
ncbi:MAG: hypothetical protein SCJ97_03100 [Bacillota bacterium]|nr:hypothetical protein [Bacillota bacterium]